MIERKNHEKSGKELPRTWAVPFRKTLNDIYKEECKQHDREFEVFGLLFEDELLLAVSYTNMEKEQGAPVSCLLSSDIGGSETQVDEILKELTDLASLVVDDVIQDFSSDSLEYSARWLETEFRNHKYFYRISRENVLLTLAANQILADDREVKIQ